MNARGTTFTSNEFASFTDSVRVKHKKAAVASPWANGLVEKINRFLKSTLKKLISKSYQWETHLDTAQYVINNTQYSAIKSMPAKLLLGYDCRNMDKSLVDLIDRFGRIDKELTCERDKNREIAIAATERLKEYNKLYYDRWHTKPTQYNKGDYVMIRDLQNKPSKF